MKRVMAITFFNYFVSGALTLIIPLLLLDRKVNLAEIGIILSVLPLISLSVRLLFAAFADQVGWTRIFVLLNWPGTLFSTVVYFFAGSIPVFLGGKIIEGIKESAYWAVNRTAIFSLSPKQEEKEATKIAAIIWLSTALGSAIAGIGIAYVGFSSILGILIIASVLLGIPAGMFWKQKTGTPYPTRGACVGEAKTPMAIASLDPRGRDKAFWHVSIAMLFYSLATYPLITLLLPAFMDQHLGYSYVSIGLAFLLYNVIVGTVTLTTIGKPLNVRRVTIQSAIGLLVTFLLANSGLYFLVLFLALAIIRGLSIGFFESIIAKVTKNRQAISVDIALLHIPMRVAEFASVLTAGFVAQSLGYFPLFASSGIFFMFFSVFSLRLLKGRPHISDQLTVGTDASSLNKTRF